MTLTVYEILESTGWEIHSGETVVDRTTDPLVAENLRAANPDMRRVVVVTVGTR